ncbi:uncharacterized protein LOC120922018 isoform X2 [Rana temporaria]|uniref:uncharacterized protein LOC120922018 isoform X2 n=1 Tax=Rana temporaria TaxID=8407 RepID=UPI001AAE007D|nr:uncharacterized protein LOC120922018 isoform X2 [Rana temporaria]
MEEGTGAAEMTSYIENSPILKPQEHFPEGYRAGHFEHVTQMNMLDDMSRVFRIPPKICLVKISAKEDPESSGLGDTNFKVPDPADSASFKNDRCCKLLNIVRQDLQLSDIEDSKPENTENPSSKKTSKKKSENYQQKAKIKEDSNYDDAEWYKAIKRVEEFLDFPAVISAMNFRNKTESQMFSQISPTSNNRQMACKEANVPIPNTRHNAVFLRDNPKAAQVILTSPYHNGEYLRTENKGDSNEDHKGNLPLKKVPNLAQKPNSKMELEIDADR